jgi:hypothetical protein
VPRRQTSRDGYDASQSANDRTTYGSGARSAPPSPDMVTFECLVGGGAYSRLGDGANRPIGGTFRQDSWVFLTSSLPNLLLTVLAAPL